MNAQEVLDAIEPFVPVLVAVVGILGTIAAWILRLPTRLARWRRRPRLRITARRGEESITRGGLTRATTPVEFVWVVIHNDSVYPVDGDLSNATARLYFRPQADSAFDLRARWRNSPQPALNAGDFAGIIDRITIRANDREELDVVLRWPTHDAYAFNTEAMRHPLWEDPNLGLKPGRHGLVVRVSGQNHGPRRAAFAVVVPMVGDLSVASIWRLPLPLMERWRPGWWPIGWH